MRQSVLLINYAKIAAPHSLKNWTIFLPFWSCVDFAPNNF